ncbi:hypothetical protein GWN91_05655, partial [Candidatus Saccharibacteria bacterium]|nr:hypothetical protein [Candidatus Saccharibacteria bacterium]
QKDFIEVKGNRDLGSQKWGELSVELTKATSQRFQLESQIVELQAIRNDPLQLLQVQTFLGNSNLSQLQKDYADANNELSVLRKSKTSEHPDVILLTKKLHSIEQKIPAEVDNFLSSLNINLKAVVNREKSLQRALQNQKNEILKADNDSMQYSFLLQEVELNEKLYNELLNRKKELEVTSNFSSSNISIVDKAEIPYKPIKPRKGLNIILAFLFGTFGGVLLVFFQESQDNAVKTEEDLKGPLSDLFLGSVITIPDKNQTSPLSLLRDFRSLKTQFLL